MAKAHDKDAGGSGGTAGLRDVYLRHGINLTRYSNHEAQRLIKLLDAANTQIKGIITKAKAVETKEKYRRVAAEIGRVAKECGEQLNGRVEADFKELAEAETAFVASIIKGSIAEVQANTLKQIRKAENASLSPSQYEQDLKEKTKLYQKLNNEYKAINEEYEKLKDYIDKHMFDKDIDAKKSEWYELADKLQELEEPLYRQKREMNISRNIFYSSKIESVDDYYELVKEKGADFVADVARQQLVDLTEWYNKLPKGTVDSFIAFSENLGYNTINKILFGIEKDQHIIDKWQADIDNITLGLNKYSTNMDMVVYRNTKAEYFEGLKEGDVYTQKGFTSTAIGKNEKFQSEDASNRMSIEIRVPKGTHGIFMDGTYGERGAISKHKGEDEFLLQRDTSFRILEKSENSMVVEIVDQGMSKKQSGTEAIKDMGKNKVTVKADFELPSAAKVWSAASFGSYADGHETFETYLNGLSDNLYKTWDTQVRAGYLSGLTAREINRAVLGTADGLAPGVMQTLRRSLERNTKTMVASMAETARDETYRKNSHLFSGYRYVGTLDSRTCVLCASSDGVVFKEIEDAPKLPQHIACRCLLVPVVKGMESFDEDDTRASVDGPVSANMTYSDWLKTQPESVQRDILGPARFEMYKRGEEISGFVADGRVMTLKQLREAEGLHEVKDNRFPEQFNTYVHDMKQRINEKGSWDDISDANRKVMVDELKKQKIDMTPEQFMEKIQDIMRDSELVRHQDIDKILNNISKLEKDPRIKTQFETGTSEGTLDNEIRNMWEQGLSREKLLVDKDGVLKGSYDISEFNSKIGGVENRPAYGELVPKGTSIAYAGAGSYGDLNLILNDEVRNRTTFTSNDSSRLGGSFTNNPLTAFTGRQFSVNNTMSDLINLYKRSQGLYPPGYTEAQFWGGIDLSKGDVKEVVITQKVYDKYSNHEEVRIKERFEKLLTLFESYNIILRIGEQ